MTYPEKTRTFTCECGKKVETTSRRKIRCDECAKKKMNERSKVFRVSWTGLLWGGFKSECNKEHCQHIIPIYLIKKCGADGIYFCKILKKFLGKQIKLTIEEI